MQGSQIHDLHRKEIQALLKGKEKKQDFHRLSVYVGLITVQIIKVFTRVSYLQTLQSISLDIRRRKHHLC